MKAGPPKKQSQCGFTLVELLVVIAIIGILAALMLPALTRSKQAAHAARCVSNLHQLGIATQLYWDDNAGTCFRYSRGSDGLNQLLWFGWLGNGSEGERMFDAAQGVLFPYLQGRGVELCPSLNYAEARMKLKAAGAAYGYGYNLSLSTPTNKPPVRCHQIAVPSAVTVLADSAQVNTFQPPASPENPMLEEFYYISTNRNEATAHFRHARRANVLFCDGHVATEKPDPGSLDQRLPAQHVGRLRTEVLALR